MSPDGSFHELMARVRGGDQQAMAEVFHRFAQRLIGLARSRLDGLLRYKADAEDVMQSVFQSFFERHQDGRLQVNSWDSLWGLLTVIAVHKCGHRIDYHLAARRDVRRETAAEPPAEGSGAGWEALAREPTPSESAVLAETVEVLLRGLRERDRPILVLSLQGYSPAEVAEQVGRSERTVFRVLQQVRKKLQALRAADGGETAS